MVSCVWCISLQEESWEVKQQIVPLHRPRLGQRLGPGSALGQLGGHISAPAMSLPYSTLLLTLLSEYKSIEDCEELVINTTATINNLSYYQVKNSVIQDKKLYIAECKVQNWVWVDECLRL